MEVEQQLAVFAAKLQIVAVRDLDDAGVHIVRGGVLGVSDVAARSEA